MDSQDATLIMARQNNNPRRIDSLGIDPSIARMMNSALQDPLLTAVWMSGLCVGIEQGRSEVEWGSC